MRIGRYEVIGELGRGGMGSVSLARCQAGELVVLKRPLEDDPDLCERLRDEARVGLRLSHPNVVETLDLFEHEGRPVLVVSYVSGASMYDLRQKGRLAIGAICRVGRQIADALDALHHATDEHGRSLEMLHRDVTPGNIMLGHDGNARLIDLGIARSSENRAERTRTGFMRGTLRYLAPELFDNKDYTPASDLWSLGLVLLEAALGRQMFRGTDAEIVGKIISGKALELQPEEELDPRFHRAVSALLKQKPEQRPKRARDAAAVFAMLEKEYGETEVEAVDAVLRAVGPPRSYDAQKGALATRLLMHRAAATFCADGERLLGDEETVADDRSAAQSSNEIYSAETEQVERTPSQPNVPPPSPPQLERTEYFEGGAEPPSPAPTTGFTLVPKTPSEELLQYAAQLRDFERGSKTASSQLIPRRDTFARTPHTPPDRAALLPVLEPLNPNDEATDKATPAPGEVEDYAHEEWASLPPTVVEPCPPDEPSRPMRVLRAVDEPSGAARAVRRSWPIVAAAAVGVVSLGLAAALAAPRVTSDDKGAAARAISVEAAPAAASGEHAPALEPTASEPSASEPSASGPDPQAEREPAPPAPEAALEGEAERVDEPIVESPRTPEMPACYSPGRTRLFAYRDARGTWVATRRFTQVPKRYRNHVRCVD